jgi:hypothetical protein
MVYDSTSLWPAPTSIQRKVRVCSSFVRSVKVANEASNLKSRSALLLTYTKKKNPIDVTEARNDAAQADGEARKMYKWYSRRMRLGGVPHRALHLLPLARPQKERARERNVQLAQILCARLPAPEHAHAPRAHLTPRDVQRARDDAP